MSNLSVLSSTYASPLSFCLIFLVFAFTEYTCVSTGRSHALVLARAVLAVGFDIDLQGRAV